MSTNLSRRLAGLELIAHQRRANAPKLSYWLLNADGTYSPLAPDALDAAADAPRLTPAAFGQVTGIRVVYAAAWPARSIAN